MPSVLCLESDYGRVVVDFFFPLDEPGLSISRLCISGQLCNACFICLDDADLLKCKLFDGDVYLASSSYCQPLRTLDVLKQGGAGVVSCRMPLPGSVVNEIFFSLSPACFSDSDFIIVGRVFDGMDVIAKIAAQKVDHDGNFFSPVSVSSASLCKRSLSAPVMPSLPNFDSDKYALIRSGADNIFST